MGGVFLGHSIYYGIKSLVNKDILVSKEVFFVIVHIYFLLDSILKN
jgi:hypothetical protein